MRKELLTLAVACLLCVPAFAADDEEPKGVSDIKEVGKVIRNPITIEATGGNQKMDVVFNHSSHRRVRCQTCHHALPSDIDAKYVATTALPRAFSRRSTPRTAIIPATVAISKSVSSTQGSKRVACPATKRPRRIPRFRPLLKKR